MLYWVMGGIVALGLLLFILTKKGIFSWKGGSGLSAASGAAWELHSVFNPAARKAHEYIQEEKKTLEEHDSEIEGKKKPGDEEDDERDVN